MYLEAIFIMWDFMKAYDQLDHAFISDTLLALGFNEIFVSLVKGLVCAGTLKVHMNGLFLQEFSLDRGARQGCSLASLLYALTMQPN